MTTFAPAKASEKAEKSAPVAELVDAPDLGSGVYDVQVRVLSGALFMQKWHYFIRKSFKMKKKLKLFLAVSNKMPIFAAIYVENHIYMSNYNLKINEKENY